VGSLADRLFDRAAKVGARVIFPERPEWPAQLLGLDFPPVLYVRGTLEPKGRRVAIVGSREADRYGNQVAGFLAAGLAERGVGVVSGGAIGVDASAHRACLEVNGPTVAVLGSGVDIAYPGDHVGLFREIIARGGAVVSHFPPGTPSVPQNFQVRNRLIAALSEAVIVARARLGSGALQTAKAARVLKRPVFGVPGDVTCSLVAGVNQMLETREAQVCTGLGAVADALGLPGEDWPSMVEGGVSRRTRPDARSEAAGPVWAAKRRSEVPLELRPVYEAMGREPVQFDELSRKCRLDAAGLASALVRLELMGLCQERVGKVFVRT
jgi:DNA processing protein